MDLQAARICRRQLVVEMRKKCLLNSLSEPPLGVDRVVEVKDADEWVALLPIQSKFLPESEHESAVFVFET